MSNWLRDKLEISHGENSPLLSMEGLRGVAVFLVFLVHYNALVKPWLFDPSNHVSDFVHGSAQLGVDLFFVLSGYLIYGSLVRENSFSPMKYAKRRIQRIYPVFLVVFALYLALSLVFPNESKLPEGMSEKLIYLAQNLLLLPGLFDIDPVITVAWSLSFEAFYYLLIPIVVLSLNLKSWSVENRLFLWGGISIASLIVYSFVGGPIRLIMFIAGIVLFELHSNKRYPLSKGGTRYLLLALAIFGFRQIFDLNFSLAILSVYVLFILVCLCAFNERSQAYKWLTFSPLRWLGNMSYSYYLIHGLALKFCFLVFGKIVPAGYIGGGFYYWFWIPLFGVTLVASFLLFLIIERPFSLQVSQAAKASYSKQSAASL